MEDKKYYLGLDMGTTSIGWAVTDKNYRILRAKGCDMWGIRKFNEAKTNENRRAEQISRRRKGREKVRIGLLREYFADEIEKIDKDFFIRLDNSKYYREDKDKRLNSKNGIFNDSDYTDENYYADYPTIFHLREELIKNEKAPYDIRLIYLAILNIFKHRGHFLLKGVSEESNEIEIEQNYEILVENLGERYEVNFISGKFKELCEILVNKETGRSVKKEEIMNLFAFSPKMKKSVEFVKCLCGLTANAKTMFDIEAEGKIEICFNDYSYEDSVSTIQEAIGEENYLIVESIKQIYDYVALERILKGYEYLSEARVDSYKKHKKDVEVLKIVYKKYKSQDEYDTMFRSMEKGTYGAYVKSVNSYDSKMETNKYRRNVNKGNGDIAELYSRIKKELKDISNNGQVIYILEEIEKENFLPKQLTGENGIIPNQVHKKELIKILENAENYLPFLKNVDESGLSVSERIIELFTFQIPYYVGPISLDSKNGWVVRKDAAGQVLPWNYKEKIDLESTKANFIERLIRRCTYLNDEKVMPKNSMLYEEYCVLNEINNIKINGEPISTELKLKIYHECFERKNRVTKKNLCEFLYSVGAIKEETEISGIDKVINNQLSSYHKMYSVFGENIKKDSYKKMAEEIIYWGTIYGDSKQDFKEKLMPYVDSGLLDIKEMKRLLGYRFKDWGRLSRELLELHGYDKVAGKEISIIQAMREYSLNFMEIINHNNFDFIEKIQNRERKILKDFKTFEFQDLEDYYFSAPVKRMVWQTIQLLKEIKQIMGGEPERIFIEMARQDGVKGDEGRKDSRGKKLLETYKEEKILDTENHKWKDEIKKADEEGSLKRKKLYLYYMQMGKDLYTGEDIEIEELFNNDKYDIDHIYPRCYVKDDSIINNLVLVNKNANENIKKDIYPIPKEIRCNEKVREVWGFLHKKNLISDEKYNRLINNEKFSEEQLVRFIERQLVETRQGTKGVANIIKELLPTSKIVYSKASNVSEFRNNNKHCLYKSRLANEYHHAHDAYLNIVVGNVYFTKFTQDARHFISKEYANDKERFKYHLGKMFDRDVKRNGEVAWQAENEKTKGTIEIVNKMLSKNTPQMTFLNYENKDKLYDINPISKHKVKSDSYVPLKTKGVDMPVEKYGGYNSLNPAYFIFIEHTAKKKRQKCFEVITLYYASKIKSDSDLVKYCEEICGYEDVRIICSKINKGSLIKMDGFFLYINGLNSEKRVEFYNATNLWINREYMNYIHNVEVSYNNGWINKNIDKDKNMKLYKELEKKHINSIYNKMPGSIGKMLTNGKEKFEQFELKKQIEILYKILLISSVGRTGELDFKEIGGPASKGRIRVTANMTDRYELLFIKQSITGIYSTVIDLLQE